MEYVGGSLILRNGASNPTHAVEPRMDVSTVCAPGTATTVQAGLGVLCASYVLSSHRSPEEFLKLR